MVLPVVGIEPVFLSPQGEAAAADAVCHTAYGRPYVGVLVLVALHAVEALDQVHRLATAVLEAQGLKGGPVVYQHGPGAVFVFQTVGAYRLPLGRLPEAVYNCCHVRHLHIPLPEGKFFHSEFYHIL